MFSPFQPSVRFLFVCGKVAFQKKSVLLIAPPLGFLRVFARIHDDDYESYCITNGRNENYLFVIIKKKAMDVVFFLFLSLSTMFPSFWKLNPLSRRNFLAATLPKIQHKDSDSDVRPKRHIFWLL